MVESASRCTRVQVPKDLHLRLEEEVGDLFFVLVNIARYLAVDPESALRKTNRKFKRRFHIAAIEWPAVEIDCDDVLDRQRAAYRRTGIDIEGVCVAARAAMAVVVDVFGVLQHPDRIDQFLFQRSIVTHGAPHITRRFHISQERSTV